MNVDSLDDKLCLTHMDRQGNLLRSSVLSRDTSDVERNLLTFNPTKHKSSQSDFTRAHKIEFNPNQLNKHVHATPQS